MSIEALLHNEFIVGGLQSLGCDIPSPIMQCADRQGITLAVHPPKVRLDVNGDYPADTPFAAGVRVGDTLFVDPDTLTAHAHHLKAVLVINVADADEERKLDTYCLIQSVADFSLAALGLPDEQKEQLRTQLVNDFF